MQGSLTKRKPFARRSMLLTMSMLAMLSATGCASLQQTAGNVAGKAVGTKAAQLAPPPKATVIVEPKGGRFCAVMETLGWPLRPTSSEVATASPETVRTLLATLSHGAAHCDWKP